MMQQLRDMIASIVPTNRDRYVKGTNSRATLRPESLSPWLRRMRAVKHEAVGGQYLDEAAMHRATRRAARYIKNHKKPYDPPSHIMKNANQQR